MLEETHMFFDSKGEFLAEVYDYTTGNKLTHIKIKGTPNRRVTFQILRGSVQ